ncbi:MAG: Rid family detoxifying hydrolase [Thermoleophilaceae bacterium]
MTVTREVISGDGVPATIGPYSAAVRAGDFVYVSGQPGVHPATGEPAGPDLAGQARQAMRNVEAVLRAAGTDLAQVVNTTVLVADISQFAVVNEVFAEAFPTAPPARMTMQVPLPRGLLISIGCVAIAG